MKGPPINHSFSSLNPHLLSGASSAGCPPSPGARTSRFLDARTNGQRDCSSTLPHAVKKMMMMIIMVMMMIMIIIIMMMMMMMMMMMV